MDQDTIATAVAELRELADESSGCLASTKCRQVADRLERIDSDQRAKLNAYKLAGEGFAAALQKRIDEDSAGVSDWQPIEEAPKDCAVLLCVAPFSDPDGGYTYTGPVVLSGYWDAIDAAWCVTTSTWEGPFVAPTHWMPLPPPRSSPPRPHAKPE